VVSEGPDIKHTRAQIKENQREGKMSEGVKREKTKQWKVGITEKGNERLNQFIDEVNKTSKRKIQIPTVVEYAVEKLSEKDFVKIRERVYTPDDKMEVLLDEHNQRNPDKTMTMEQFKATMVDIFERQLSKSSKATLPVRNPDETVSQNRGL